MKSEMLSNIDPKKVNHFHNPASTGATWRSDVQGSVICAEGLADARREIEDWDGYQQTPLYSLSGLAAALGVKDILYKDEAPRFGLGSFKALGGPMRSTSCWRGSFKLKHLQPLRH